MTMLPEPSAIKLGLVIDLDICVGCQACVVNCKEWNTAGYGAPLADEDAYGAAPMGAWLNRVHAYEVSEGAGEAQISRNASFMASLSVPVPLVTGTISAPSNFIRNTFGAWRSMSVAPI